jgi:hypothetical protein
MRGCSGREKGYISGRLDTYTQVIESIFQDLVFYPEVSLISRMPGWVVSLSLPSTTLI